MWKLGWDLETIYGSGLLSSFGVAGCSCLTSNKMEGLVCKVVKSRLREITRFKAFVERLSRPKYVPKEGGGHNGPSCCHVISGFSCISVKSKF